MSEELLEQPDFETLFHVEVAENRRLSDALDGLRAVVVGIELLSAPLSDIPPTDGRVTAEQDEAAHNAAGEDGCYLCGLWYTVAGTFNRPLPVHDVIRPPLSDTPEPRLTKEWLDEKAKAYFLLPISDNLVTFLDEFCVFLSAPTDKGETP